MAQSSIERAAQHHRHPTYEKIITAVFNEFSPIVRSRGVHLATVRREVRRLADEKGWILPKTWMRSVFKRLVLMEAEGKVDEVVKLKFAWSKGGRTKEKVKMKQRKSPKTKAKSQKRVEKIREVEVEDVLLSPPPTTSELELPSEAEVIQPSRSDELIEEITLIVDEKLLQLNNQRIEQQNHNQNMIAKLDELTTTESTNAINIIQLISEFFTLFKERKQDNLDDYFARLQEGLQLIKIGLNEYEGSLADEIAIGRVSSLFELFREIDFEDDRVDLVPVDRFLTILEPLLKNLISSVMKEMNQLAGFTVSLKEELHEVIASKPDYIGLLENSKEAVALTLKSHFDSLRSQFQSDLYSHRQSTKLSKEITESEYKLETSILKSQLERTETDLTEYRNFLLNDITAAINFLENHSQE